MNAIFFDRDGTLIEEREYLSDPNGLVFLPHTKLALRRLQAAGYLLILVTNQSGVGRGFFTEEAMQRVHEALLVELRECGVDIAQVYAATEAPDQLSEVRKPAPGFLLQAQKVFGIELDGSYMIGDKMSDLECGWRAGVKASFLVRTGYGVRTERELRNKGGSEIGVFNHLGEIADYLNAL